MIIYLKYIILLVFIGTALFFDLKQHRIPNHLNMACIFVGVSYNSLQYGLAGFLFSIKGFLLGLLLMFLLYRINAVGAGDVKLFAALGSLMGGKFVLFLAVISLLLIGTIAIVYFLIRNRKRLWRIDYMQLCVILFSGKLIINLIKGETNRTYFPLMAFIAPAVLITLVIASESEFWLVL